METSRVGWSGAVRGIRGSRLRLRPLGAELWVWRVYFCLELLPRLLTA